MLKQQIIKNFSKSVKTYDAYSDVQRIVGRMLSDSLPQEGAGRILEIGCGTGIYTDMLLEKHALAEIESVDISPAMIEAAEKRLKSRGVKFIVCDGEKYTPSGSFDLITSNATLHWFSDIGASIERYSGYLAKSGTIAFSVFGPETFAELKSLVCGIYGETAFASDMFMVKESVEAILKKYFSAVTITEERMTRRFASLLELLRSIKHTGVRGPGAGNFVWTRDAIAEVERSYISKHGSIEASYQAFLCKAAL
jgi:malonyl-CoA O-methyltransferase